MNKIMIKKLFEAGKKIEAEHGIPAVFIVAQAILEQGWNLQPIENSNNIYGIKYHISEWGYVNVPTIEYINGQAQHVQRRFQKYPTLTDCVRDHTSILLSDIKGRNADLTYRECLQTYKKIKDYKRYVECVAKSYATDPAYAYKILQITEVLNEMGISEEKSEAEEAKEEMVKNGIFKPYGTGYWETHCTREDLAIILRRFEKSLTITLNNGGEKDE